jgi:hypothetical protein
MTDGVLLQIVDGDAVLDKRRQGEPQPGFGRQVGKLVQVQAPGQMGCQTPVPDFTMGVRIRCGP